MQEQFKDIKNFEGRFKISNFGNIVSINGRRNGEHKLIPGKDNNGYPLTILRNKGKKRQERIHVLVAEAFIPIPDKIKEDKNLCVNHLDGNKENNIVSNLEWTTRLGNSIHAQKTGLINNRGIKHPNSKITEADVLKIRELYKTETSETIAGKFNIKRRHVSDIINGICWAHLPILKYKKRKALRRQRANRKIGEEKITELLDDRKTGLTYDKLAKKYGVTQAVVYKIVKNNGYPKTYIS